MKENTGTIIAMLEELLTVSRNRQASQSGGNNTANMDITPIRTLIEEADRRNRERTEAELAKFAKGITDSLNVIGNRIDRIARREQPDFGEIRQLLERTVQKADGADIRRNINETRHSFALENKWDWTIVTGIVLLIALLASALYFERRQGHERTDNDLKYRYIRMKGEASPESIAGLENLFELNRDNGKINRMRKDVETYEEAVRRQAALIEQARLKEWAAREYESKADSVRNKPSKP
ncbi:hypothetical protein [Bacteroides xylanisolvens]|jgi:hypothetical protein|uniref:hypothetical protein n=1 Tax=Bacteroides xylanisolvens TaxID=371601 RepID=UPI00189AA06D|nr:hypothetical protein [Bacteroides xylanisolvens]